MHDTLPLHPTTGLTALALIGGRPVWPILGGSEQAPEQPPMPPAAPPAQPPAPTPPAAPPAPQPGETAAALAARYTPEQLAAMALQYRGEAGDSRATAKRNAADEARTQLATQVAKALGLVPDDAGQVKPEQLAADLAAARTAQRESAVELELYRTAAGPNGHGGITGPLLSMLVQRNTTDLDPAAGDFSAKVVAAAKAAVAANPMLKVAPVAAVSGGQFNGGSVERDQNSIQPGLDRLQYAYGNPGR